MKNKFRGSLNFWAEGSADQKSNLCIGQPKIIFLVGHCEAHSGSSHSEFGLGNLTMLHW